MVLVSIIIINYNTFQLTCNCIESIIQQTKGVPYEIILIDNASSECNPDLFSEKFPIVRLIKNETNSGFAKGNNLGINFSKGEIILLLNSDTYLIEDSISKMSDKLKDSGLTGVIGCRMTYPDGEVQHTARKFRSIRWELLDLFRPLLFCVSYRKRATLMLGKYFKCDFDTTCDWLNGAFFMFRKELLNNFPDNELDDRFFMYGEDQWWCWQVSQFGYINRLYTDTTIIHISSGSSSLQRQLAIRQTIIHRELAIMKARKGNGLYYYFFAVLYVSKEQIRNLVKSIVFYFSGKLLR